MTVSYMYRHTFKFVKVLLVGACDDMFCTLYTHTAMILQHSKGISTASYTISKDGNHYSMKIAIRATMLIAYFDIPQRKDHLRFENCQLVFVPNSDHKEFVVLGTFYNEFVATMEWIYAQSQDYKALDVDQEKTQLFRRFVKHEKINDKARFFDFGCISCHNYIIIFGGCCGDSLLDCIFYFDCTEMKWFESKCVK